MSLFWEALDMLLSKCTFRQPNYKPLFVSHFFSLGRWGKYIHRLPQVNTKLCYIISHLWDGLNMSLSDVHVRQPDFKTFFLLHFVSLLRRGKYVFNFVALVCPTLKPALWHIVSERETWLICIFICLHAQVTHIKTHIISSYISVVRRGKYVLFIVYVLHCSTLNPTLYHRNSQFKDVVNICFYWYTRLIGTFTL